MEKIIINGKEVSVVRQNKTHTIDGGTYTVIFYKDFHISKRGVEDLALFGELRDAGIKNLHYADITNTGYFYVVLNGNYGSVKDRINYIDSQPALYKKVIIGRVLIFIDTLHSFGIAHLNIDIDTVFVSDDFDIFISSPMYKAEELRYDLVSPEIALGMSRKYKYDTDVWQIGIFLVDLLSSGKYFQKYFFDLSIVYLTFVIALVGKAAVSEFFLSKVNEPFFTSYVKDFDENDKFEAEFSPFATSEEIDLLRMMLHIDPDTRASIQDCLYHPYFDEILTR